MVIINYPSGSRQHLFILLALILSLLNSCALQPGPVCVKHGKIYGRTSGIFRSQWDDYYERALSYMEGECYQEALCDLNEALKQRFRDQWMARTYGIHFIDYFPHREKGLIHYLTGDYDAARSELELSLQHEPSAKAFFYLDRVRNRIMEQDKQVVSIPHLTVRLPSGGYDEIWTRDDPVTFSGTAEDEQYISEIVLAGRPVFIEVSAKRVEFIEDLKLTQGRHEINITARNLLGGTAKRKISIHVDRTGPLIILEKFDPGVGIQGYIYDESGVSSLIVDGEPAFVPEGKEVAFSVSIRPGIKGMTILAMDRLGNQTQASVNAGISALSPYPLLMAQNLVDAAIYAVQASPALPSFKGIQRPEITLSGWRDEETAFLERVYIDGQVRGQSNIEELTINNTLVHQRAGRIISFNYLIALKEGKNTIRIRARDESGNTSIKEIFITRRIPRVFQLEQRYSLAMYPFDNTYLTAEPGLFQYLFLRDLADRNRFQIMVRKKLKKILREQKLDLGSKSPPQEVKPPLSTLLGTIYETRNGIEIVTRLIDNKTSKILAIKDVYSDSKDHSALKSLAGKLAEKFHREFPLIDAMITKITGEKLIAELGKGKANMGWPLIVYREDEPRRNPVTGRMLGSDTRIIGDACIDQLMKGKCGATLASDQKLEIRTGDRLITQ
ncbi:MAG: hypothetical protein C4B58_09145 [Deltaproteobacteria bacterium]|nr:MAG: hypothetical protein C4B58_09145 [Deltaproteobacteria bacterium]